MHILELSSKNSSSNFCFQRSILEIIIITIMAESFNIVQQKNRKLTIVGHTPDGLPIYQFDPNDSMFEDLEDLNITIWPKPKKNEYFEECCMSSDHDRRIRVKKQLYHKYPYYCMGLLISDFEYPPKYVQRGKGTATLVAPNVILTCAHNICKKNRENGTYVLAQKVIFTIGHSGIQHVGEYEIKKPYIFSERYLEGKTVSDDIPHDWAFLVLEKSVPAIQIPIPLIVETLPKKPKVGIYGFPDKGTGLFYLYGTDDGEITVQKNDVIEHSLDTNEGQSGSAILAFEKGHVVGIIGVHSAGQNTIDKKVINHGSKLSVVKFSEAQAWMQKYHNFKMQCKFQTLKLQTEQK